MRQYAVCHVSKGKGASKGLTEHNEREKTPKNADPKLSNLNRIEDFTDMGATLEHRAKFVIEQAGVNRKIQSDAVLYCPIILSGSHETMEKIMKEGKLDEWMRDNRQFLANKYGEKNIISFAMHADETTPHIHCSIVPIVKDISKKGKEVSRLSARDVFSPGELKKLQTEYAQSMNKWGLERGMDSEVTRAKHQDVKQVYRDLPEKLNEQETKLNLANKALSELGLKNETKSFFGGISGQNELKLKNEALLSQNFEILKELQATVEEVNKLKGEKKDISMQSNIYLSEIGALQRQIENDDRVQKLELANKQLKAALDKAQMKLMMLQNPQEIRETVLEEFNEYLEGKGMQSRLIFDENNKPDIVTAEEYEQIKGNNHDNSIEL